MFSGGIEVEHWLKMGLSEWNDLNKRNNEYQVVKRVFSVSLKKLMPLCLEK